MTVSNVAYSQQVTKDTNPSLILETAKAHYTKKDCKTALPLFFSFLSKTVLSAENKLSHEEVVSAIKWCIKTETRPILVRNDTMHISGIISGPSLRPSTDQLKRKAEIKALEQKLKELTKTLPVK